MNTVPVLLLNAGSSSLKATVMRSSDGAVLAQGMGDWAGAQTHYEFAETGHAKQSTTVPWKGHGKAVERFLDDLPATLRTDLSAVGHRVVHGGSFTFSVRITAEVRDRLQALIDLAPLHNPPSLEALAAAEKHLPDVPHVAVFDTAFHTTMPAEACTYPVPARWTREWAIRRYGFHGLSHAYCARRAAEMLGRAGHFVICHLGHGCSASAVREGRCIDTTMGFTPLEGLMMATRSGSLDPSIVLHLQQKHGLSVAEIDKALNRESGLLGVSGVSSDMRAVLCAAQEGNEQAQLALAIYAHRVRQAIGALTVTLAGVDALIFTAGVGEHAAPVRASICKGIECLGLRLDPSLNAALRPDADIASADSTGRILVIQTREDITMLHEVLGVVDGGLVSTR